MSSLLTSTLQRASGTADGSPTPPRRPVLLLALLAGIVAAGATLLACLLLGLVGWFLSDAGVHGPPREAMRAGATAWLMAHGSGLTVQGAAVTVVPLGLTVLAGWTTWRVAQRLGESVWGHGPDVHRLSDGERDWTVPVATGGFGVGYATVALVTASLVAGSLVQPDRSALLTWSLLLTVCLAAPAIAAGSGRGAVWAAALPPAVRHGAATAVTILLSVLGVSAALLVVAFALSFGEAANMVEQLGTTGGETTLLGLVNLALLPNAVLLAGSFLVGPGFAVGVGTLVSPSAVVLGPLPVLPLLAALPDPGTPSSWWGLTVGVPVLVAAAAVVRLQRRRPTLRWDEGALRGCGGGIVAGAVLTVLASLAGGAAGPGRMREVGVFSGDLLVHSVTALGLGGLLGGLVITWWQRRTSVPADEDAAPES
ncbi:DUF6350 family protein [Nocardioides houyundeii]|uniref:cell division protein PerM n=1 Tax=Nocardioides houyundeii TaxID=2045452 RepID=UPI000C75D48E|nr:DUF6350 family protein [Nocardioides houyundeii]